MKGEEGSGSEALTVAGRVSVPSGGLGRGRRCFNHERHGIHERVERLIDDNSPYLIRGIPGVGGRMLTISGRGEKAAGGDAPATMDCLLWVGMSVPAHPWTVGLGWCWASR